MQKINICQYSVTGIIRPNLAVSEVLFELIDHGYGHPIFIVDPDVVMIGEKTA